VLVPAATARFGIISDIDDTVLWTNVTNKLNMALLMVRSNAHTRKPFQGVAAFYRALSQGVAGNEDNPVFVSSGSWPVRAAHGFARDRIPSTLLRASWACATFADEP
jgi:phosphatidate phosphatase APP1